MNKCVNKFKSDDEQTGLAHSSWSPLPWVSLSVLICSRRAMMFPVSGSLREDQMHIEVIFKQGNENIIQKSPVNLFDKKPREQSPLPAQKRELYKSFPHCEFPSSKILLYLALSLHTYPETNLHVSRCDHS